MPPIFYEVLAIYISIISLVSIIITIYDKRAATRRPDKRVPEARLILFSLLGGSLCMYITMQAIRHKTKHAKFMIGIPLIMILQLFGVFGIYYLNVL